MRKQVTQSVRLARETARLVKLAAAAAGEPMSVWVGTAVHARLAAEGKLPARLRVRDVSVSFEETADDQEDDDAAGEDV